MLHDIFVIGERLGIGATAEVFASRRRDNGENRALKIFTPMVLADPDTVKRIETEVSALRTLRHPNIVHLFASHSGPGELALELEYVRGSDLRVWRKGYSVTLHEPVLWILSQVARGIGCAHENGILHRDLKPENVLVSDIGHVKLTDFGLARQLDAITMTKSGLMAGSIGYMAPEMLDGENCTPLSDVFSFGAVAYELLAGVNPFAGPNPQSMMKRMMTGEFRPLGELVPGLPPRIETLIHSCLATQPSLRPASIWHVEAELMNSIAATPLLKHCRALVSSQGRGRALEAAFIDKRRELEARRAALTGSRPEAISLARDWAYSLPDSSAPHELLAALGAEEKNPPLLRAMALLLLMLFVGSGGWLFWLATRRTPVPLAPSPIAMVPVVPAASSSAVVDAVTVRSAAPTPPPAHGWIHVEADDDVTLFLDGAEVPRKNWKHIAADPGRRRLRLVKSGFLPIENVIPVRAGRTAVVNAKGNQ